MECISGRANDRGNFIRQAYCLHSCAMSLVFLAVYQEIQIFIVALFDIIPKGFFLKHGVLENYSELDKVQAFCSNKKCQSPD